jgi:hypothetical protein
MVEYTGVSVTDEPAPSGVKQQHYRAVLKNGDCNLYPNHVSQHTWRFVQDSVTTVVDMQWRYALFLCTFTFFFSWTAFALLWWFIAYAHGDFEHKHLVSPSCMQQTQMIASRLYFEVNDIGRYSYLLGLKQLLNSDYELINAKRQNIFGKPGNSLLVRSETTPFKECFRLP